MKNEKIVFCSLILLFLISRLFLLFGGLEKLFYPDELYRGLVAKTIMEGNTHEALLEYQADDYAGGSLVVGILAIPFFYIFGESLISLKLVALVFSLTAMVLWYFFVKRYINYIAAIFTTILFIFAPPTFACCNLLSMGFHCETILFTILIMTFFFRTMQEQSVSINCILFGMISGFAIWFCNTSAITVIACIVFWFIKDIGFYRKKTFWVFCICFLAGFSIWIYYNTTHDFQGIKTLIVYGEYFPQLGIFKKIIHLVFYDIPYSFCFPAFKLIKGIYFNYLFYGLFLISFIALLISSRGYLSKLLYSQISKKNRKLYKHSPNDIVMTKDIELFFFCYISIFAAIYTISKFTVRINNPKFIEYKYIMPLYPFIFSIISIGMMKLWNKGEKLRAVSIILIIPIISISFIALLDIASIKAIGKGIKFKGYSYSSLYLTLVKGTLQKSNVKKSIIRLNKINNEEICKNQLCNFTMYAMGLLHKLTLEEFESLVSGLDEQFRYNCYEGYGHSIGITYGGTDSILEKIKLGMNVEERYRKYLYYGIAHSMSKRFNQGHDNYINLILQVDEKYRPYFFQGFGYYLAKSNRLLNIDKKAYMIEEPYIKYWHRGIGQFFGSRLEWAFADKEYYIGFDGLNKDYLPDCYYGLGWGIGDFFEFDMDRYLAVINNNVSSEYIEYCYKGLADRLRWKFGKDNAKLQRVLSLIPAFAQ